MSKNHEVQLQRTGELFVANQKKAGRAPGSNIVASQQQQRRSALPSRGFRLRYFFVFDNSSSVASLLDGRNVHERVFTAALRLNKSIALGRIEPLHGTFWHLLLQ
jgi:hypothetical protein